MNVICAQNFPFVFRSLLHINLQFNPFFSRRNITWTFFSVFSRFIFIIRNAIKLITIELVKCSFLSHRRCLCLHLSDIFFSLFFSILLK